MTNLEEKTPEETFKEIMERFEDRLDTAIYDAEKIFDHREEYLDFLKDSLVEFGESLIGQNQGYLEEDIQNDSEDVEKFNDLIDNRNGLRAEQRRELEKISK